MKRFEEALLWLALTIFTILAVSYFLSGCASSPPAPRAFRPLARSLLVPKTGFSTLTSGRCAVWKDAQTCATYEDRQVDLADPTIRDVLRSSTFICKVGSKPYLICPDRPGLCFHSGPACTKRVAGICFKHSPPVDDYIDQSETEKLKELRTICFNQKVFPYLEMR